MCREDIPTEKLPFLSPRGKHIINCVPILKLFLGPKNNVLRLCFQVLCPRCDVGTGNQKSRSKKAKETTQIIKKSSTKLESLCDVERALSESKDSASAVSEADFMFSHRNKFK